MHNNKGDISQGSTEPAFEKVPGQRIENQSMPDDFDAAFDRNFPAPEPRKHQKKAVRESLKAILEEDKDVVVIDAPPGFGKSVVIYTILRMLDGKSYYGTPLKALQEQLVEDEMMTGDIVEIMGRQNYDCILPDSDPGTTVDEGKCHREEDFNCEIKSSCPYYSQKAHAKAAKIAVMNLAYMMSVPMTMMAGDGQFAPRDVMVIDECQGTDDWATQFVSVTVSDIAMPKPVAKQIEWPDEDNREDYDFMVDWLRDSVLPTATGVAEYMTEQAIVDKDELKVVEAIEEFSDRVQRFLKDQEENEWRMTYDVDINKNRDNNRKVTFEPVKPGRFLDGLLWDNTDKVILASATVPKGDWFEEVGLGDADIRRLNIPSEFPVENRPIVTSESVGKMTYDKRDENIGDMVKKVKNIAEHHEGEKGIVHCRGYNYVKMFKRACTNDGIGSWYRENVAIQDRDRREESLEEWIEGDKQVFLSVNMAEGIDLEGDRCRWQVLLKTLYPSMNNERVSYRVNQMNDWTWYNQKAVIQIEQAYGRAVRGPEDNAVFYILDESAVGLIERNEELFHDWFLEGVQ